MSEVSQALQRVNAASVRYAVVFKPGDMIEKRVGRWYLLRGKTEIEVVPVEEKA